MDASILDVLTASEVLIIPKVGVNGCAVVHTITSVTVEEWAAVICSQTSAESSSNAKTRGSTGCIDRQKIFMLILLIHQSHTHKGSSCQDHS